MLAECDNDYHFNRHGECVKNRPSARRSSALFDNISQVHAWIIAHKFPADGCLYTSGTAFDAVCVTLLSTCWDEAKLDVGLFRMPQLLQELQSQGRLHRWAPFIRPRASAGLLVHIISLSVHTV